MLLVWLIMKLKVRGGKPEDSHYLARSSSAVKQKFLLESAIEKEGDALSNTFLAIVNIFLEQFCLLPFGIQV